MATLNEIAYNIRNIVSGGISSDDDNFSLRQLKFIINNHRANLLLNYTNGGRYISPVIAQSKTWDFNATTRQHGFQDVPELLAFNGKRAIADMNLMSQDEGGNYGVSWSGGALNKWRTHAKYTGTVNVDNPIVGARWIANETGQQLNISQLPRTGNWQFKLTAIFADPRDADGFNDDTSRYPFPEEMITLLTQRVLSKEYTILLQSSADLMNNALDDKNVSGEKKNIDSSNVQQDVAE